MRSILFLEQKYHKKNEKRSLKQRQARASEIDELPMKIR
jgi:hypothetical protein